MVCVEILTIFKMCWAIRDPLRVVYFSKKLVRVEFGRKSSSEIYIPGSATGLNFINQMPIADQID